LSSDAVEEIVQAHEDAPGLVSSCGDDALDEELFQVFMTLVSKCDELIFIRRIFITPLGMSAGKARSLFGGSVAEQQGVPGGLVLVAWTRELIRVKHLADIVGRGTVRHGIQVEAQLRPSRRERFDELLGHFVHSA
jgi:hypothetical protein